MRSKKPQLYLLYTLYPAFSSGFETSFVFLNSLFDCAMLLKFKGQGKQGKITTSLPQNYHLIMLNFLFDASLTAPQTFRLKLQEAQRNSVGSSEAGVSSPG
jgi:hypothetical protein